LRRKKNDFTVRARPMKEGFSLDCSFCKLGVPIKVPVGAEGKEEKV